MRRVLEDRAYDARPVPAVLLIRHGQASFGAADYDALSERGHEQAALLPAALDARGITVVRVVCGTLRRQTETAAPFGDDVAVDARWNEYDSDAILHHFSQSRASLEGDPTMDSRTFQELLDVALVKWAEAGGDGDGHGETWAAFRARSLGALEDFAADVPSGTTGVAITSGGVIGAIAAALLGLPDPAFVSFNRVTVNAAFSKVVIGRSGRSLVTFNDHAHLEPTGLVTYR